VRARSSVRPRAPRVVEEGDENIFPLRLPETTRGRTDGDGGVDRDRAERNGAERSRRASTRGRKGTESAAVVVVRRSIHPSVQAPTPTSTGDAADADADDGRWDETTGAIVVVASRGAAWAPTTPTPTTGRRPGRRRARGGKG